MLVFLQFQFLVHSDLTQYHKAYCQITWLFKLEFLPKLEEFQTYFLRSKTQKMSNTQYTSLQAKTAIVQCIRALTPEHFLPTLQQKALRKSNVHTCKILQQILICQA